MSTFIKQGLTLKLNTGVSLGSASLTEIDYLSPDGQRGHWTASVDTTNVVYNIGNNEITTPGYWEFQSHVVLSGLHYYGDVVRILFEETLGG